jgi:hypothetical protein
MVKAENALVIRSRLAEGFDFSSQGLGFRSVERERFT